MPSRDRGNTRSESRRAALLLAAAFSASCSLGNVHHDDCASDNECISAFGLGSRCDSGFCTDHVPCKTGYDCRRIFGGGACVSGACTPKLPTDPACTLTEPPDLMSRSAVGDQAPFVIGSVLSLAEDFDQAQTSAISLAIREINRTGGDAEGHDMGIVFCDIGGPMDAAEGDARAALVNHAMDYLSGTLGVPAAIGPSSSADALLVINRLLQKRYPTVVISSSATSPALTDINDRLNETDPYGLFWRTCPSDVLQAQVLANDVIGADTTITNVAVAYIQDTYGEGLSTAFQNLYGISRTELIPFTSTDDFSVVAGNIAKTPANGVLIISVYASDTVHLLEELVKTSFGMNTNIRYFFTDGSKDSAGLLDPTEPAAVQAIIKGAVGTAPAINAGNSVSKFFETDLLKDFGLDASSYSFLAHSWDATYVAAYGIAYATADSRAYDGLAVAEGMAHLSTGMSVAVGPMDWNNAKTWLMTGARQINIEGASGHLDFDATTGEAPGPIEEWKVNDTFTGFDTVTVYQP